eukprot:GHVL01018316.1.p2 GENE.GHVL01018316.1~~GHVL01018316.1.p2  ORF type:complete len:117 (-),score=8.86 GHVL01018316.1:407-757(-)
MAGEKTVIHVKFHSCKKHECTWEFQPTNAEEEEEEVPKEGCDTSIPLCFGLPTVTFTLVFGNWLFVVHRDATIDGLKYVFVIFEAGTFIFLNIVLFSGNFHVITQMYLFVQKKCQF